MRTMATHAPERRLPVELEDFILEFLHGSTKDLKICALVCRRWLYISRSQTSIRVSIGEGLMFWDRTILGFLDLINHPAATLPLFTRHLIIQCRKNRTRARRIINVLKRLTSLCSLSIVMESWDSSWHNAAAEFSRFSTITELSVEGTDADNFGDIVHLACSLPSLRKLRLVSFDWFSRPIEGDHGSSFEHLHTLVFEFCSPAPVLWYLISLEAMPPIHTLRFKNAYDDDIALTNEFIKAMGPHLTELEIHFDQDDFLEELRDGLLTIDNNPNLRRLILSWESPLDSTGNAEHLPIILSTVESPNLQDVIFVPPMKSAEGIGVTTWSEMALIFEESAFSRLSRIVFGLSDKCHSDLEEEIRKQLPACHERGILCFIPVAGDIDLDWWADST